MARKRVKKNQKKYLQERDTRTRKNEEFDEDECVFEWMLRVKEYLRFGEANSQKEPTDSSAVDSCDLDAYRYRIRE